MNNLMTNHIWLPYTKLFVLGYYCLLRVSELTCGRHPILAKNVTAAINKLKIQVTLLSSKTHRQCDKKQVIRFPDPDEEEDTFRWLNTRYCPFTIVNNYIQIRNASDHPEEPFFVFGTNTPVKEGHFRRILKKLIKAAGYSSDSFNTHSFRIGRANHLMYKLNFAVDRIKLKGRWVSDAIWKYFR